MEIYDTYYGLTEVARGVILAGMPKGLESQQGDLSVQLVTLQTNSQPSSDRLCLVWNSNGTNYLTV